ncbi:MAG: M20/M25/M40 family metallo-hydrolase [Candidatus Cloacimonetes bacterium]|jgi:tripeptide aminopeptidase|nr:M20/M25/M40 family metallo-hydrolase [Candidatus Cloacimonadota bacterium]MDD4806583.1 M20/M25/M40 family metallo-hydrolase [Candidatus Cloacimonadota bacterium]
MQNDVIQYFLQLVTIDSESLNERRMIDALKIDLEELGCIVEEDDCQKQTGGNAGNLHAIFPGTVDKAPILFCSHVDTVSPGKSIKATIVGEKIVSDGTTVLGSDDKSGIAEIMIALKRVKEAGKAHAPVEILFTVSEEIGLLGAKGFDKSKLKAGMGYALDSHNVGELITGAPCQKSFDIIFHGKEAHAGVEPEKGLNAIRVAAEAIAAMPNGRIDFETTCNVGLISGGEATNIVPSKVVVKGEARSHNLEKLTRVCEDIHQAVVSTVARYESQGASFDYECITEYDSFSISAESEVVKVAQEVLRGLNIPFTTGISGGGSDANVLSASGIPIIITGTGMQRVHTVKEFIELDQLRRGADFVEALIYKYSE